MLINKNLAIRSSTVTLVPYCKHHVRQYHQWMKDPDIQAATASEPLCIKDEFAMQRSWRTDADKLTFISLISSLSQNLSHDEEIKLMLGDINLFIIVNEEDSGDLSLVGEVELMIPDKHKQHRGLGRTSILVFMKYIATHEKQLLEEYFSVPRNVKKTYHFDYFRAKIGETNSRSIGLFESLGFEKQDDAPNWFGEWELRLAKLDVSQIDQWLAEREVQDYREVWYDNEVDGGLDGVKGAASENTGSARESASSPPASSQ